MTKPISLTCPLTGKNRRDIKIRRRSVIAAGRTSPELGLQFYVDTFKQIKSEFPTIKLHALGPPEVAHITKLEKSLPTGQAGTHHEVLKALKEAGMDSCSGPGPRF